MDEAILVVTSRYANTKTLFDELIVQFGRQPVAFILVDDHGIVLETSAAYAPSDAVLRLFQSWEQGAADYDDWVRVSHLQEFPLVGAILPVLPSDGERTSFLRNATAHCVDSARILGDRLSLLLRKGVGASHGGIARAAGLDEHLHHVLSQVDLTLELTSGDQSKTVGAVRSFLDELPSVRVLVSARDRREKRARRATRFDHAFFRLALLSALLTAGTYAVFQRSPPFWVPWTYLISLYTAMWGVCLAAIPTRSAFSSLEENVAVIARQRSAYRRPIVLHGLFLLFFVAIGYCSWIQLPAVVVGFSFGIILRELLVGVFIFRARLKSLTSAFFGTGTTAELHQTWDALAERTSVVSRTFLRPRPYVFISYRRCPLDTAAAEQIKSALDAHGVEAFLDVDQYAVGVAWRVTIAENIVRATHLVFLLSRESLEARTCVDELRFALTTFRFNIRPTITLCLVGEEATPDEVAVADPVFGYLFERAPRVTLSRLVENRNGIATWVEDQMPSWWLRDLLG